MSDLFQQFKELGFDAGDLIGRQYAEIFENIAVQINKGLSRWVADRAMLYHASEKSGLGSNNTSNEKEANANAINNGSLQGNRKGLGKSFEILGLLSKIIKTEDKDSVEYAMLQLAKLGTEPKIKSNSKRLISSHDRKMRARAAIKPKIIKEEHAPSKEITICDECGSDKLRTVGTIAEIVKTATDQIYKTFDQKSIVQRCICGNIMINVPYNYDPPAIPTGHLGQSIVIRSIVDETHGMPENHANIDLQRNFQIGNDTLPRSKSYLTENIGEPMYKLLNSKLKDSPVVMADETLFPVLQLCGKHRISKEIKDDAEKLEELAQKQHSKNYVALTRTPPDVDKPIVLYHFINDRKTSTIQSLFEGGKIKYLVSDALPVYDAVAEALGLKRQSCLVHLRREIIKRSNAPSMGEDLEPLSDEERERKLEQAFKERDPTLALTCVLRGISRIYELETEACRLPGESYESHLAKVCDARQKQLEVYTWAMTVLSAVCTKFAEQHTSRSGKIRWVQAKAHRLAKLAVYVLNHKDQFGTFLQTGEGAAAVPSHNNPSEGSIRALIVLRKACNFKSSEYGIKHACINFSLVQTAEECGIANVERWLQDYSRAAYIYASRRFFRESIDGPMAGIPNRPTFKIADYLEGFDFEYWLPWNYLKRNPGI